MFQFLFIHSNIAVKQFETWIFFNAKNYLLIPTRSAFKSTFYIKMFHQNVFQVPTYHTYVWVTITGCLGPFKKLNLANHPPCLAPRVSICEKARPQSFHLKFLWPKGPWTFFPVENKFSFFPKVMVVVFFPKVVILADMFFLEYVSEVFQKRLGLSTTSGEVRVFKTLA